MEAGLITEAELMDALSEAKRTGDLVGNVLIRQGRINREQLGQALSIQYSVKYVNIAKLDLQPPLLELLPEEFMLEKRVLPVAKESGRLVVAMVDPSDRSALDEITFITGMRPQAVVTTSLEFLEACNKCFRSRGHGGAGLASSLMEEMSNASAGNGGFDNTSDMLRQQREAEMSDVSNPLVKLVNSILEEAIQRNASDIHIEPRTRKYLVRFRIDGILRTILDIPQNMEASLVTRVKVMSRMDIAEHRRPQDGRFSIKYQNTEYNLRVNTLPVSDHREKIVIRILRPANNVVDFKDQGLGTEDINKLETLYQSPHGIVLVCGPTGSGKTTTLYTMLSKINDDARNIATVEDPVELAIEGLNQSQVNPKADYTFASSMRALLRQDPDVIMVGEIRDYETLEAAIHAALTGHLVFSTIHSNTAAATITRLIEMGAAPNLISSALMGIIAQRLVRATCTLCKAPYEASLEEKKILFPGDMAQQAAKHMLHRGAGCSMCGQSGYQGRIALYEILMIDREIRHMISASRSDLEIEDAAVAAGMETLSMSGRNKVLQGRTTLEEVTRILGPNLASH